MVTLNEVVRQKEPDLIKAVHEAATGFCSVETLQLLNRLSRPLPPGKTPVRLCGRRFDCDVYNADKLMDRDGLMYTYKADSSGKESALCKMIVPEVLYVKVGYPVLLVKNLSSDLVNGMHGVVRECLPDAVVVEFSGEDIIDTRFATIKRQTFSVYNRKEEKIIASRYQLPLILGYSLTIHKAQGITLERVEVDASNIFSPGQLGVAIGRAKNKKGLRIIGFRASQLLSVSPEVTTFYERTPTEFTDTFECCKYSVTSIDQLITDYEQPESPSDEDSDFSDTEIYEIDNLFNDNVRPEASNTPHVTVDDLSASNLTFDFSKLNSIFSYKASTTRQTDIQNHLNLVKANKDFKLYIGKIYEDLNSIIVSKCNDIKQKTEAKHWTAFYTELYRYTKSEKYVSYLTTMFQHPPTELDYDASGKIVDKLEEIILEEKSSHMFEDSLPTTTILPISDAGLGKIRYIGGRCVAKAKYHLMKSIKPNLYKSNKKQSVNIAFAKVRMLDYVSTRTLDKSKCNETLKETERKQNLSRGLTHITDECFTFFCDLNRVRMQHQTEQYLQIHGAEALIKGKEEVLKNKMISEEWHNIFRSYKVPDAAVSITAEILNDLLLDIVSRFLKIGDNQFRKDVVRKMGKKKSESLRKKVAKGKKVAVEKGQKEETVSTENEPIPGPSSGVSEKAVEEEVANIGKGKKRKRVVTGSRSKAGPSGASKKGKSRKGKGKKSKDDTVYCGYCQKEYTDEQPWVQCDKCNEWFDCECQNITSDEFDKLSKETDDSWFCIECR